MSRGSKRDIAIVNGRLAGILSAGVLSGLLSGLILAIVDRQTGPVIVVASMVSFGLVMTLLNRLFTARGRFFTFYSNPQLSFNIGWDWFVSIITAPIVLAVIFPDLSSILWRFPPSFIIIGPLLYALWLFPYRFMVVSLSGLNQEKLVLHMAEAALNEEMGNGNGIDITFDSDGTLHLRGFVADRDRQKDARQAVVGLPGVKEIDTSELKIRARM